MDMLTENRPGSYLLMEVSPNIASSSCASFPCFQKFSGSRHHGCGWTYLAPVLQDLALLEKEKGPDKLVTLLVYACTKKCSCRMVRRQENENMCSHQWSLHLMLRTFCKLANFTMQVKSVRPRLLLDAINAGNPLGPLLPCHSNPWWPLVEDIFSSVARVFLARRRAARRVLLYISMDGAFRICLPILGQGKFSDPEHVRVSFPFQGKEAYTRVVTLPRSWAWSRCIVKAAQICEPVCSRPCRSTAASPARCRMIRH